MTDYQRFATGSSDWCADGQPVGGQANTAYQDAERLFNYYLHNMFETYRKLGLDPNLVTRAQTPATTDPATRRAEIEAELEILRGRVPTPKGYVADPGRIKKLMQELGQLNET